MKIIKHFIIIAHLLISSIQSFGYAVEPNSESKKALEDLSNYCADVAKNPLLYSKNAKDKSIVSVPVETSKGVIKFDTLIKIDHANGPDYISCFQHFKSPLQEKSLANRITESEAAPIATCKPGEEASVSSKANSKLGSNLQKVSDKMICEDAKATPFPQCVNDMAYCGLDNLNLTKVLKVEKSKDLKCNSMLGNAGNLGECMATFIRGAFDEITDTLKLLVVDGPKWIYNKTVGKFFQEPAVKQMENVGTVEAIASSKATNKEIKQEIAEPSKSLVEKITAFTKHLILDKGAENYGCTKWSSGIPGVGTCVAPGGSWECTSCKQKAMILCGVAGYATGLIVETAVLAAPIGVIAGSAVAIGATAGVVTKVAKIVKGAKAGSDVAKVSTATKVAKSVAGAGVKVSKATIKVLAPIGKAGYKIGKDGLALLKLIPGVELTAKVLATPFKLWMKTDNLLTSKVWNLTYHGSKAYTQTLVKTGNVALAAKSASVASKLNQTQKAGEALLKTQAEIKAAEGNAGGLTLSQSDKKKLNEQLASDQKRYESLSGSITAKEVEDVKFLESEHAAQIADKYKEVDASVAALALAKVDKTEEVAEVVAGPALKLTAREAKAEELAKIIAVDEETQKLISDPVIAQYIYLNHFAPVKEQAELRVALQDIANSVDVGHTDLFTLVNEKLSAKLKDPAVQAKVKEAFENNDKALRPGLMSKKLFEVKTRAQQIANMPKTLAKLKGLTDEGFSIEVLDQGLFDFYGATQLGLKDSQLRQWALIPGGFSAIRPNQIENISPELWANMAHFASET